MPSERNVPRHPLCSNLTHFFYFSNLRLVLRGDIPALDRL